MTVDAGTFEFTRLGPGTYFVSALAKPWYAFHPQQMRRLEDGAAAEQEPPRSSLDVAYATTFYVAATDSSAETPIALRAGDHPQINLTLHSVPQSNCE